MVAVVKDKSATIDEADFSRVMDQSMISGSYQEQGRNSFMQRASHDTNYLQVPGVHQPKKHRDESSYIGSLPTTPS